MSRGRQDSSGPDGRRSKLQSVPEKSGFGQMIEPPSSKYGGDMVSGNVRDMNDDSLDIDPNLLVGPLYVPKTNKADRIKAQLGDITANLHQTLYDFDVFDGFTTQAEDPVIKMMRQKIGKLGDSEMRSKLTEFMDEYEDMSVQVQEANQDRDEMLLQLADWFTTDHVDLDDIKSSLNETEEDNIKQSYLETVTNFEKIKTLQMNIANASKQGKNTAQLEQIKKTLEDNVVDQFKVMKDMSMQTMKLNTADDAPWRHAANEIVGMLKNVRGEHTAEVTLITQKMQSMVDQLEKQGLTIKSLTAELREKKGIVKKLTDENSDMSQDVAVFRARYTRYEKDLEAAKQLIRSLHQEKMAEGGEVTATMQSINAGKTLSKSISKVLSQFTPEEPDHTVKEFGSDPALLRTQLREYQEALECIKSELARFTEAQEELEIELSEKKIYINNMEEENEKLIRDIRKMRQERRQSIAVGAIIPTAGDKGHKCEHCKCHVPEKEIDEEVENLKKEVNKWQDKTNYFKKILADTEMKLSEAFKEISDLRMDREVEPQTVVVFKERESKDKVDTEDTDVTEKSTERVKKDGEPKQKPKPKARSRYMDTKVAPRDKSKLPGIDRSTIEEKIEEQFPGLSTKQTRELKLYKAGDLQGKLNLLTSEIMEFVTDIGKMLHQEKEDDSAKIQQLKAFTFDESGGGGRKKAAPQGDPKEEEAKAKKSQVIFSGQHACSKLREAFDTLSNSLSLKHDEYEAIYRSFKVSQQRNAIRQAVMMGRMPTQALQDFDKQQRKLMMENSASENMDMLSVYFNISAGGGGGTGMQTNKPRHGGYVHRKMSSNMSFEDENDVVDESEGKLKKTINVLSMQRSKSDLDVRETPVSMGGSLFGGGMFRERSQMQLPGGTDGGRRESISQGNKAEMKIGVAVIPRKGLISLSTTDEPQKPLGALGVSGQRGQSMGHPETNTGTQKPKQKSLIKNKTILEALKQGTKQLEDEEAQRHQEEEMTKSLGEYTIMDLQSNILNMVDHQSSRKPLYETPTGSGRKQPAVTPKLDKPLTLPAIKNFNPFST